MNSCGTPSIHGAGAPCDEANATVVQSMTLSDATATIYVSDPIIRRVRLELLDNSFLRLSREGELIVRGKDH